MVRWACYAARMELSSVNVALELIAKATKAFDSVRERAKTSNDASLKEGISKLWDEFLDLKAVVVRLTEENAALRRAQVERPVRPEIRQMGEVNYYFVGEEGPFCQPCYDRTGKLVNLTPRQTFAGGTGRSASFAVTSSWRRPRPPRGWRFRGGLTQGAESLMPSAYRGWVKS